MDIQVIIAIASVEPVILLTADGRGFLLSEADDFDSEVDSLRASDKFQRFVDERSQSKRRISLAEIESEFEELQRA